MTPEYEPLNVPDGARPSPLPSDPSGRWTHVQTPTGKNLSVHEDDWPRWKRALRLFKQADEPTCTAGERANASAMATEIVDDLMINRCPPWMKERERRELREQHSNPQITD